jgi:hypothetical protein
MVFQRNSVTAKILTHLEKYTHLVTYELIKTRKEYHKLSYKEIPVNPTVCHGINKFQGYKRFCILLQQDVLELYCRELKKHFLLWKEEW